MYTIGIIGGGAAGMMCAATILEELNTLGYADGVTIELFEKNIVLGRKVSISGGGRCNVTTGVTDRKTLLSKYTRGGEFFKYALGKFGPKKVVEWFVEHGVPLKCEEDLRIFPQSDNGKEVIDLFHKIYEQNTTSIQIHYGMSVQQVEPNSEKFMLHTANKKFEVDILVVTTGGNAYAHTGSTGDGYNIAKIFGHTITQLGPSLSSFELHESFTKNLSGISLERATLISDDRRYRAEGPILMTHFGISGPLTFSYSSQIAFENVSATTPLSVRLIPLAGWTMENWDTKLRELCETEPTKILRTLLAQFFAKRFVDELAALTEFPLLDTQAAKLSRDERKIIARILGEGIKLTIVARRAGDEFVTAGGVTTSEINPETLESKLTSSLYFAGEVLDIDGVTGGYNLQVAWATGNLAGRSIAQSIDSQK